MDDVISSVQRNCDLSDARHAGDSTMCIYLMRMREHYKWISGIPAGESFDHGPLGAWIAAREEHLESLEDADYSPVRIGGDQIDPFDHEAVCDRIADDGMVYGAGCGNKGKPVFFLGEHVADAFDGDHEVVTVGREYAREMSAPVAMSLHNTIYVRRDAFTRLVWQMFDEWSWRRPASAFSRAISKFGSADDPLPAVQGLVEHELGNLVLHEAGEIAAGKLLGNGWRDMLAALINTPLELPVRYVKDNLADSLTLMPKLLSDNNAPSIHFYFAGTHPVREQLFPSLMTAYREWHERQSTDRMLAAVERGRDHWLETALELMAEFDRQGTVDLERMQMVIERCTL